ncbi:MULTISPECIES: transglycosylase SLT domain-containing protein [Nocardioides]|uniref:transglycosylase SLT domain-containing protein n=1 Tax=Nocardioides TaxID=1839 RepID=UPI002040057D|nr:MULTISPECIES: transglycosylase SLT domain-containing protein [Nocardioides]MCM3514805.1 transglycosylase SLT domain-containing protein [Nocardioides sp. P86]
MSVSEITSRIAQIQSQLALLGPSQSSGSAFAASLSAASSAAGASATGAAGSGSSSGGGSALAADVIAEAKKYVGMPYVWGGSSPAAGGMDCSGLVQYVYGKFGVDLPRVSADQARAGQPVASMAEARPGDLIAWDNSSRNNGADHIAIYLGGGKMLEAPRTGLDIRIVDVPSTPDYIRRVLPDAPVGAAGAPAAAGSSRVSGVPFSDLFNAAGQRYGVDPVLLASVARQESGFDPKAVSPAGAQGLMQLMPGTADGLGVTNSFDPAQAVDGAARLLRDLLDRFGRTDLALAGYNAGPGAVLRYDGIPPYPETQNYVRSVMAMVRAA